jgi:hypothetical protein
MVISHPYKYLARELRQENPSPRKDLYCKVTTKTANCAAKTANCRIVAHPYSSFQSPL